MSIADKAKDKAKRNPNWLLGVLLILHLIAVSFNRAPRKPDLWVIQAVLLTVTTPFQSGLGNSLSWFSEQGKSYLFLRGVRAENQRLQAERAELETRLTALSEQVKSFEQLQALENWRKENGYRAIPARVVGRDANYLFKTVVIDKGATHGVQKGQPVIDAEGLVGRVIFVAPFSSRVILVTDERHGAGAVIGISAQNRLLGIVKGIKENYLCQMDFISPPVKVENGEKVLTSGQDGIYPPGLLIGRVANPADSSGIIPQRLMLQPAAALGRLETVAVLQVTQEQIRGGIDAVVTEEQTQEKTSARKK